MRFEELTTANVKITVLWDVVPWGLIDHYQHFEGTWCFHHHIRNEKLKNASVNFAMLFCLHVTTEWIFIKFDIVILINFVYMFQFCLKWGNSNETTWRSTLVSMNSLYIYGSKNFFQQHL
jgi:hypothetical protein